MPTAYIAFESEQHGYRKSDTITKAYETTLYFHGKIFGFEPAGELRAVAIENLQQPVQKGKASEKDPKS
ncbi:MAG: hypothetical protein RLN59_02190 [Haliea sp.]